MIQTSSQENVQLFTLVNSKGTRVTVTNLGASLISVVIGGHDVVLGYEKITQYFQNKNTYFGATVGRNANRTGKAQVCIKEQIFRLPKNEGENNLHSGPNGYQVRLWEVAEVNQTENCVCFTLISPDGDQGFPGNLEMTACYTLTDKDELQICYRGVSDKATIFNPTNHAYFNLNGHDTGSATGHRLQIMADQFTPVTKELITTGELRAVVNTAFDFTSPKAIERDIAVRDEQLVFTRGFDHNWVLNEPSLTKPVAIAVGDQSKIQLEVFTNLPGIQFYAGNFIQDELGKDGATYQERDGFCLETQFFPNSGNHVHFPSPIIEAGQVTERQTIFKFTCLK